ncbi:MAG: sigma-70 family RNA polymerase sigma factor [Planctomycetaceae bacterium]|jgi:RNA polymerase sigma-70 factor, ECF subfamily|nr:sigma-70 family RNA polymerase sigma factor [Planctomycetaceae bacterium]MBT6496041.1 sigma-70 family RNA polymerase sigma factor [Planctomycetaceae bacterium]
MEDPEQNAATEAREIFDRFSRRLIAVARTRLDRPTQRKIDAEDVVQSVFRSFFTRRETGQLAADSSDDMWKILVVLTVRKCARKARDLRAARRDLRREVELPANPTDADLMFAIDRQPLPDEIVMLVETLDQLMAGATDVEREIIVARLDGFGPREISERIGSVSERKVYRVLAQVRKRLEADM